MNDSRTTAISRSGFGALALAQWGLLTICLGVLYHDICLSLFRQWWQDPDYSHGFIVPLFSVWVVWNSRQKLKDIKLAHGRFGWLIAFCGLGILVLGSLGAEEFLSRASLPIVIAGLLIQFRGWRYFRVLVFPWAVLFLAIPLPAIILNEISLPLQYLASSLGSTLLKLVGIPIIREGNLISMPAITLDVAEACSGLRFLISLITLATIYGYLKESNSVRRVAIVCAAIPVAIGANGLRIMGSGIAAQYGDPELAAGFFHTVSGVVVFAVALALLVFVDRSLGWADRLWHSRRNA